MANGFGQHQIEALQLAFEGSNNLTREKKIELVEATGLNVEQVSSWYSRKRASKRARETIAELELARFELERALELSHEREVALQDENQRLKQRLTIADGDDQFGSLMSIELVPFDGLILDATLHLHVSIVFVLMACYELLNTGGLITQALWRNDLRNIRLVLKIQHLKQQLGIAGGD
ncbi:hypothetical protein BUALT_Bualt07G0008600 [Buddleja alternifolia]|uniref:Homeobox domain-containing protein n=1 Tax=Buddleja alternifolia TaxID=168488 RepID=A0AAV6XF46_9LAMI|nr:hypothetical protein BUALT_Bualt07G0008600 [Buddleja alternifolia]